jgi:transposase
MMPIGPATRIYLAAGATDLRKSFEGLSDLVRHEFREDPLSGHLFVFANRKDGGFIYGEEYARLFEAASKSA